MVNDDEYVSADSLGPVFAVWAGSDFDHCLSGHLTQKYGDFTSDLGAHQVSR